MAGFSQSENIKLLKCSVDGPDFKRGLSAATVPELIHHQQSEKRGTAKEKISKELARRKKESLKKVK